MCAEGYISNRPRSGYYVEAQFSGTPSKSDKMSSNINKTKRYYEYDFSSKSIDDGIININEWKKYVKEVLNQNYLLTSYGEEQGEEILRNALQKYSLGTRSVNTSYENIIVGAGTQTLLHILCSLLGNNKKSHLRITATFRVNMCSTVTVTTSNISDVINTEPVLIHLKKSIPI